jgi:hypothetical protein
MLAKVISLYLSKLFLLSSINSNILQAIFVIGV